MPKRKRQDVVYVHPITFRALEVKRYRATTEMVTLTPEEYEDKQWVDSKTGKMPSLIEWPNDKLAAHLIRQQNGEEGLSPFFISQKEYRFKMLEKQAKEIEELKGKLEEAKSENKRLEEFAYQKNFTIFALAGEGIEKDNKIRQIEDKIKEKNTQIEEKTNQLKNKDEKIKTLESEIKNKRGLAKKILFFKKEEKRKIHVAQNQVEKKQIIKAFGELFNGMIAKEMAYLKNENNNFKLNEFKRKLSSCEIWLPSLDEFMPLTDLKAFYSRIKEINRKQNKYLESGWVNSFADEIEKILHEISDMCLTYYRKNESSNDVSELSPQVPTAL